MTTDRENELNKYRKEEINNERDNGRKTDLQKNKLNIHIKK